MSDRHLTYEGVSVRAWGGWQTRNPKPRDLEDTWGTGYECLELSAWDLGMPEIPLGMRYEDFKQRLDEALARAS